MFPVWPILFSYLIYVSLNLWYLKYVVDVRYVELEVFIGFILILLRLGSYNIYIYSD